MTEASIPVDLFNPGQVFACLGFLEAVDVLLGDAEGGFDWSDEDGARFVLRTAGDRNPFEEVLEFLAHANLERWGPTGYVDPPKKSKKNGDRDDANESGDDDEASGDAPDGDNVPSGMRLSGEYPAAAGDQMTLPIRLGGGNRPVVDLSHWADGSSRHTFKLYSGNRSAYTIAKAMLQGTRQKPTKKQTGKGELGDLKSNGVAQLWERRAELVGGPFDCVTPMGGSFNFDPRGAWTAIDAGYSPNEHKHRISASPVVEILAAWGLEHARPMEFELRQVRYFVWGELLPPMLARAALAGGLAVIPTREFRFELDLSGKNKVVTFAQEEPRA